MQKLIIGGTSTTYVWSSQPADITKPKNGCKAVNFTDIHLKFVGVA